RGAARWQARRRIDAGGLVLRKPVRLYALPPLFSAQGDQKRPRARPVRSAADSAAGPVRLAVHLVGDVSRSRSLLPGRARRMDRPASGTSLQPVAAAPSRRRILGSRRRSGSGGNRRTRQTDRSGGGFRGTGSDGFPEGGVLVLRGAEHVDGGVAQCLGGKLWLRCRYRRNA